MTALSLPRWLSFGRKPKAPPSPEDLRKMARIVWLGHLDAPSFLRYVRLEPDEHLRSEAAFQFLFNAGNFVAKRKCFTDDMRQAVAWPYSRTMLEQEFRVVDPVLRPLLESFPSLDAALLQNITVARTTYGWDNAPLLFEACLERMVLIQSSYGRISPAAAEIVVAFLLKHLGAVVSHDTVISSWWRRRFDIAEHFAAHRTPPGLSKDELQQLRNALVGLAPHHAHVVQEKLMALPA